MTNLKAQLAADLTANLRAGKELQKSTLRMTLAAITAAEKAGKVEQVLDDEQVRKVIALEVKKRQGSVQEYLQAATQSGITAERQEYLRGKAEREAAEAAVLQDYLPQQWDSVALNAIIERVISEYQATGMRDMGRVVKQVMQEAQGAADGKIVSDLVRSHLQG